jgi:hypothetical protein
VWGGGGGEKKKACKGLGVYTELSVFCVPKLSYIQRLTRHNVEEFYIPGHNAV